MQSLAMFSEPPYTGRYVRWCERAEIRINSLSFPTRFRHIQLKLNFCLPVASQLLHPKEMCLNAALNQIALYLYTYISLAGY